MSQSLHYMRRCFSLAHEAQPLCRPNPAVGCVLVRDGVVVGEGFTQVAGQAHAEIKALQQAGAAARGATAYVSLEPCAHHGKTGPCTEALIASGVSKVVFGMIDPNPLVSGRGLDMLRNAGILVEGPVLESEALELNRGFSKRMQQQQPYVRCKMAMSLDGRTAMQSGESQWITGPEARADVQLWRARSCAVLTGAGTLQRDDAALNVRLEGFTGPQPLRVIVDSKLKTLPSAKTLQLPGEVLIACARADEDAIAKLQAGAGMARLTVKVFADSEGRVDLAQLMRYLATEKQCNEVLVESGATLGAALLKAGVVDELLTYIAPALLGSEARPLFDLQGLRQLSDSLKLQFLDVAMVGKDCRMRSRVLKAE